MAKQSRDREHVDQLRE